MAELKRHRDVPKERVLEGLTHPCDNSESKQARVAARNHDPKPTGHPPSFLTRISLKSFGFP